MITIKNIDIDLNSSITCGQCFRFKKLGDNKYIMILKDRVIKIIKENNDLIIYSNNDDNLENVASTMGINRIYMIKDVFIPQCKFTLLEMFSYFFVNCMMTISAVSFLATTMNKPVSLMINQFEAQMQLEEAAVVSLMILLANLIIKLVVYVIKGISNRKKVAR